MSTQTMASRRAYQLADAIEMMAHRLGSAESDRTLYATLHAVFHTEENRAKSEHWSRAASRRRRALHRLTAALRDLPMKEEK